MEIWREVTGYEGLYEVSDIGRIRSLPRNGTLGGILTGEITNNGYIRVKLHKNNKFKRFMAHRLVADAFLGPRPPEMTVNHKDGNKTNNVANNLEYLSQGDNARHSFAELGRSRHHGSTHPLAKLNETKVALILTMRIYAGRSLKEIASTFNVSVPTISMIVNRRIWKDVKPIDPFTMDDHPKNYSQA